MQHCQTCGAPARYIAQYGQWWCDRCQRYVAVGPPPGAAPPPAGSGKSYLWLWLVGGAVAIAGLVLAFMLISKKSEKDFEKAPGQFIEEVEKHGDTFEKEVDKHKGEMQKELEDELRKKLDEAVE